MNSSLSDITTPSTGQMIEVEVSTSPDGPREFIEHLHLLWAQGAVHSGEPSFSRKDNAWVQYVRDKDGERNEIVAQAGDDIKIKHVPFWRFLHCDEAVIR